jgi:uncharacterized phiE125 gp8 family phage protein
MKNIEITTQSTTDFTTKSAVKEYLEMTTDNTYDDSFDNLITRATTFIQNETHRQLLETTYQETIDGDGTTKLFLSEYPIISVDTITIDDDTVYSSDSAQDGASYYIYNNPAIIRRSVNWPENYQNIVVTYDAGYSTIPGDLEQACIELVAFKYENKDYIGLKSQDFGSENIVFNKKDIPEEILSVINGYEKVNI